MRGEETFMFWKRLQILAPWRFIKLECVLCLMRGRNDGYHGYSGSSGE